METHHATVPRLFSPTKVSLDPAKLTARQCELVDMLEQGTVTNAALGAWLGIGPNGIKYSLRGIFATLGMHSRTELSMAIYAPNESWTTLGLVFGCRKSA